MASIRESVELSGRLKGMGRDVACSVTAIKVTLQGTNVYEYTRPLISGVYEDLPNGRYQLEFDRRVLPLRRQDRAWLSPLND